MNKRQPTGCQGRATDRITKVLAAHQEKMAEEVAQALADLSLNEQGKDACVKRFEVRADNKVQVPETGEELLFTIVTELIRHNVATD